MTEEKEKLFSELRAESERLADAEEKILAFQAEKEKMEQQLNESMEKLDGESHQATVYQDRYKAVQDEIKDMTAKNEEAAENINRLEGEKGSLVKQVDSLNE